MSSSNLSFCLPALHSTAHLGSPPTHGTRRWLGTLIAWGSVGRSTRYWFAPGILDADWLVQVPNSLRLLPSLPSLPSPHTSQVHTHGIRAAGDPSSAARAPVSKRRLSKHHRSCPPIRVWYQSMTSAPAVAQQWWRAGGDAAHPGQVRLLEFLLSIIILMILMILIIITAPFTPSCCVRRYAWLAPCRPNATRSRHAGPHSHLRSERASE